MYNFSVQKKGQNLVSSNQNNYKPSKKTLSDHIYYLGSAKQAADYDTTMDFILNHIVKAFTFGNDIAQALSDKKPYNIDVHRPLLVIVDSKLTKEEQAAHTRLYDMEFKAEYDAFMKCKQFYEANITKAYALLWEQCSKGMQGKIEANKIFESTIKSNPIELLKLIHQNCLNYHEHRYEMLIIMDLMKT
jgi:hypothetical protein